MDHVHDFFQNIRSQYKAKQSDFIGTRESRLLITYISLYRVSTVSHDIDSSDFKMIYLLSTSITYKGPFLLFIPSKITHILIERENGSKVIEYNLGFICEGRRQGLGWGGGGGGGKMTPDSAEHAEQCVSPEKAGGGGVLWADKQNIIMRGGGGGGNCLHSTPWRRAWLFLLNPFSTGTGWTLYKLYGGFRISYETG